MKKIICLITLLICSICVSQNQKIDSLFIQFKKASFYKNVYPSKLALENYQKEVIPKLVELSSDTTFVKLTGTGDLIYPGAEEWYGHGQYVPYAMDWISIRAGWLIEELTFQDFGYETTNTGNLTWKDKPEGEKLKELRKLQAEKVKKWWKENGTKWTRLESLKEALLSNNVNRISNAVQFLRFGKTECDGLNREVFLKEIKPLALKLRDSENKDINEIGKQLENEELYNWLDRMEILKKKGI
jgi:hypothetical protein